MAMHFINRNRVNNLVEFYIREQQESHAARNPPFKAYPSSFQSASASKKRQLSDSEGSEEQRQSESNITHTSQHSTPGHDGHCATSAHSDEAELASLDEELLCRGASDLLLLRMAGSPPETEAHEMFAERVSATSEKHLDLNAEPASPSDSPTATLAQSSEDLSAPVTRPTRRAKESGHFAACSDAAAETSHKRKRPAQQPTKTCPKCGKKFSTGQALGGHMRKHWNGSIRVQTKQLLAEVSPTRTSSPAHSHSHESDLASPQHDVKQRRTNEAESNVRLLADSDIDLSLKI
ncbi:hypothetical protein CLOM_g6830 [Closterium sp. NIES-68]|nr:hypothetical protein CLOM_g6830 [Closterium sp. NIES-68]GJP72362.1 hypothetical protein CLOP_g3104 [Closterium sp. NIES-67]GJP75038.1 hypothetical protein CLOP_g5534 [Closterium sp. NIES-67]